MNKITEILSNRRVWAGIVAVIAFIINTLGYTVQFDSTILTDLLTSVGNAIAMLVPAILALWSYLLPKK